MPRRARRRTRRAHWPERFGEQRAQHAAGVAAGTRAIGGDERGQGRASGGQREAGDRDTLGRAAIGVAAVEGLGQRQLEAGAGLGVEIDPRQRVAVADRDASALWADPQRPGPRAAQVKQRPPRVAGRAAGVDVGAVQRVGDLTRGDLDERLELAVRDVDRGHSHSPPGAGDRRAEHTGLRSRRGRPAASRAPSCDRRVRL